MSKMKRKKRLIVISSILVFVSCICLSFLGMTDNASAMSSEQLKKEQQAVEVVSYNDVFENYYERATMQLQKKGIDMILSFEQFCEGYYSHDYDIATYTKNVVETVTDFTKKYLANNKIELYNTPSSSSPDADYILNSKVDYVVTPKSEFKREPDYNGYDSQYFDLSSLQDGDIIHERGKISQMGHTAMISDADHDSEYGSYIQTIEAVGSGVSYGMLDDNRIVRYGVSVLRVVDATYSIRRSAIAFMKAQVGKPYTLNIARLNTSWDSSEWYCSELCYAAYKYAGIDIYVRQMEPNLPGLDKYPSTACYPWDIYCSYNTYDKCVRGKNYIDIQLMCASRWQIRVFNNTGSTQKVYYNSKMCFENDARDWIGLKNEKDIEVADGTSETINIKENWFATDIAISVIVNNNRYVTYAHNLSNKDNIFTMDIFYN